MRQLLLLRHAKSSWDHVEYDDHDRPLAPRGERAANLMAVWFAQKAWKPDHIVCSTARRTRDTLDIVSSAFPESPAPVFDQDIYLVDHRVLRDYIRDISADYKFVMVVGHNPGIGDLAWYLAGDGAREDMDRIHAKYPTAAAACLTFDHDDWSQIGRGTGHLTDFKMPRDLV